MPQIITNTADEIREGARKAGLIPVDGKLSCATLPILRWTGNWTAFLDLAASAGAKLIYLDLDEFHPIDAMIAHVAEALDETGDLSDHSEDFVDRVYHRLEEVMAPWLAHDGEPARLVCTWMKDGVAHVWKAEQRWYIECRQALEEALDELYDLELAEAGVD